MRIPPLTSKTISALRLPLIIGVMFIHNSSADLPGMDLSEAMNAVTCWGEVNYIIKMVSGTLAACAVPLSSFQDTCFLSRPMNFAAKSIMVKSSRD